MCPAGLITVSNELGQQLGLWDGLHVVVRACPCVPVAKHVKVAPRDVDSMEILCHEKHYLEEQILNQVPALLLLGA